MKSLNFRACFPYGIQISYIQASGSLLRTNVITQEWSLQQRTIRNGVHIQKTTLPKKNRTSDEGHNIVNQFQSLTEKCREDRLGLAVSAASSLGTEDYGLSHVESNK